jgi:mannosyltransferase
MLIVANQARIGVQKMIQKQRLEDVVMVSNIESLERDALYQGALALLFPSRGEGFGYPVVEAMRQGCPPIVWQEGPAMEIVASTVPLLTNLASEEIVAQMSTYESLNSESQAELAERLIKRSFLFNEKNFGQSFFEAMTRTNNLNESVTYS